MNRFFLIVCFVAIAAPSWAAGGGDFLPLMFGDEVTGGVVLPNVETNDGFWPAWVQAIGSIVAIFVAIYIAHGDARRSKSQRDDDIARNNAERKAKVRSLSVILQLPLNELRGRAGEVQAFWEREESALHHGHNYGQLRRGKIQVPEDLSANMRDLYLLGDGLRRLYRFSQ